MMTELSATQALTLAILILILISIVAVVIFRKLRAKYYFRANIALTPRNLADEFKQSFHRLMDSGWTAKDIGESLRVEFDKRAK